MDSPAAATGPAHAPPRARSSRPRLRRREARPPAPPRARSPEPAAPPSAVRPACARAAPGVPGQPDCFPRRVRHVVSFFSAAAAARGDESPGPPLAPAARGAARASTAHALAASVPPAALSGLRSAVCGLRSAGPAWCSRSCPERRGRATASFHISLTQAGRQRIYGAIRFPVWVPLPAADRTVRPVLPTRGAAAATRTSTPEIHPLL